MKRFTGERSLVEPKTPSTDATIEYKLDPADAEAIVTGEKPFEVHGRRVACAEVFQDDSTEEQVVIRGIATVEAVEDTLTGDQRPSEIEKVAQLAISQPS